MPLFSFRFFLPPLLFLSTLSPSARGQTAERDRFSPPPGWTQAPDEGRTVLVPETLPPDQTFSLTLFPSESLAEHTLEEVFRIRLDEDAGQLGPPLTSTETSAQPSDWGTGFTTVRAYEQPDGKPALYLYTALPTPDGRGQVFRVVSTLSPDDTKARFAEVMGPIIRQIGERAEPAGGIDSVPESPPAASDERSETASSPAPAGYATAPGRGLRPEDIEAVYFRQYYTFGVGGMMISDFEPYLLLADGTVFTSLAVPPEDLDVEAARRIEPDEWGTWRRDGAAYVFTFPDEEPDRVEIDDLYTAFPAEAGETLEGTWRTVTGGGNTALGGTSIVIAAETLRFDRDGRFALVGFGGGGNENVTVGSRSASQGAYRLDGHTLQLSFDDGRVERSGFYFFEKSGRKNTDAFGIGNTTYSRRDD